MQRTGGKGGGEEEEGRRGGGEEEESLAGSRRVKRLSGYHLLLLHSALSGAVIVWRCRSW